MGPEQKFASLDLLKAQIHEDFDILPGLKALGNNRAVAPMRVDVSQAAATLAVFLHLPPRPFFVSECPPATNIFTCELKSIIT